MERKTQKPLTAFLGMLLFAIILFSALFMTGCSLRTGDYTEEQHKQRISERLEKEFSHWSYSPGKYFDSFEVYPLYDENENLVFFLIELEPFYFEFVKLVDDPDFLHWLIRFDIMYQYDGVNEWSPYKPSGETSSNDPNIGRDWILDENGEKIVYKKSPYYVTGNIDNRKYIIETEKRGEYVCAVKENGKFVNLISGDTFEIENGSIPTLQATFDLAFRPEIRL